MKPFNLDLALQGEPVITRNKNEVTQIHKFDVIDLDAQELYAVIDDQQIESFYLNGQWREKGESGYDLFMAEKEISIYINLWQQLHSNGNYISSIYTREDLADLEIENNIRNLKHIKKIKITL